MKYKNYVIGLVTGGLTLFLGLNVFTSCMLRDTSGNSLIDQFSSSANAVYVDRDHSHHEHKVCGDRRGCEKICDLMFQYAGARNDCYELDNDDIQELQIVFEHFSDNSVRKSELEDIDDNDLEEFLSISVPALSELIIGNRSEDPDRVRDAYSSKDAKNVLEWISENEDIAQVFDSKDEYSDVILNLMIRLGSANSTQNICTSIPSSFIKIDNTTMQFGSGNHNSNLNLNGFSRTNSNAVSSPKDALWFVRGFSMQQDIDSNSFSYASSVKGNDTGVAIAHQALKQFCMDALNEDVDDEETKRCMQVVYCTLHQKDKNRATNSSSCSSAPIDHGVIEDLDQTGEVGNLHRENCKLDKITGDLDYAF